MSPQASHNPGYLPTPLSTFIGREREVADLNQLLSVHRLVTLTGPGGCGKTRLAIKVSNEIEQGFENGIWLTELASLTDPHVLPQTVAATLGIHEQQKRDLMNELINFLKRRDILLVFDNCEHLVEACA